MKSARSRPSWWLFALLLAVTGALAQQPNESTAKLAKLIDFKIALVPDDPFSPANAVGVTNPEFRRGEVVTLEIAGIPIPKYYTYPFTQRTPTQKPEGYNVSKLTLEPTPGVQPLWPMIESDAQFKDTELEEGFYLNHTKPFTLRQDILILPDAAPGPRTLKLAFRLQVCEKSCTQGTLTYDIPFTISNKPAETVSAAIQQRLQAKPPEIKVVLPPPDLVSKAKSKATPVAPTVGTPGPSQTDSGLFGFIVTGAVFGFVSLLTPCVFPMIPITVSFFLKKAESEHHRPWMMASIYCGTIIVVLTIAAVAFLSVFRELSTNPWMNLGLGALFVFFALSLFGMYEIELPSGLAKYTSAREGQGGVGGTIFMALTFTIISFTCVAPFLGGFGGTAASSSLSFTHRFFGGLAFSIAFASPFFVLALFPGLLKKMPKSGSWMNAVKVVMGFLELAAALVFFRTAELRLLPEPKFLTYDMTLGLYVMISFLIGLYLLGIYRLPHDSPEEHIGVLRLLFSLGFLTLGVYLLPGLFKSGDGKSQRPQGSVFAWVDSFILGEHDSGLPWQGQLAPALAEALASDQLVFVDFTGKTCKNCKLNERDVFPRPEVMALLKKYKLVQLYTDIVPNKLYPPEEQQKLSGVAKQEADAAVNLMFQRDVFNTEELPLYLILKPLPGGKWQEVGRVGGLIQSVPDFVQFLQTPLKTGGAVAEAK